MLGDGSPPMTSRPWTHKESIFLTQSHDRCGIPWCASQLHRTVEDCVAQLKALGAGQEDGWIDIGTAGRLASCSGSTIRALTVNGFIEGRKTDVGRWEVRRESVLAYAAEHQRVTEESGLEVAKGHVRPKRTRRKPKEASVRPVEAKDGAGMGKSPSETEDAPEAPSNAQNGHVPKNSPVAPLPDEQPAESSAIRPAREPSPQAMDLSSMSKLDILKALAAGRQIGGVSA